jgi:selenocysteine lyase/cysteine desulfurase
MLRQVASDGCSLFALTGQSNISNHKHPLSLLSFASSLGYHTLLDAAALAPTSRIDLTATPADAMAVSFYKMFGYPTGVGALIAKKDFLAKLKRPWFSGRFVYFCITMKLNAVWNRRDCRRRTGAWTCF